MLEVDPVRLVLAHEVERAVVVDVAVLEDLDERSCRDALRAVRNTSVRCPRSVSIARATNVASAPIAMLSGLNGQSSEPIGVDFVTFPSSLVGEY